MCRMKDKSNNGVTPLSANALAPQISANHVRTCLAHPYPEDLPFIGQQRADSALEFALGMQLPGYNAYREVCSEGYGLKKAENWADFKDFIPSAQVEDLKKKYRYILLSSLYSRTGFQNPKLFNLQACGRCRPVCWRISGGSTLRRNYWSNIQVHFD